MGYDLFKEAVRLAADPSVPISGEQILLIKEWYMGASYKVSGNESTLALKNEAVTSDTRGFVEFLQKKCEWLLGRFSPPEATHTLAHSNFESHIELFTSHVLQTTIHAITHQIQTHQQAPNGVGHTTPDTQNPLGSVKRLEGA